MYLNMYTSLLCAYTRMPMRDLCVCMRDCYVHVECTCMYTNTCKLLSYKRVLCVCMTVIYTCKPPSKYASMYICMYIYMYVCVCVCMCAYAYIYVRIYVHMYARIHIRIYLWICIYTCTRSFILMHVLLNYIGIKPIN